MAVLCGMSTIQYSARSGGFVAAAPVISAAYTFLVCQ